MLKELKRFKDDPRVQDLITEAQDFLAEDFEHEYPCSNSIWDFILPLLIVMIIIFITMSCMKNK